MNSNYSIYVLLCLALLSSQQALACRCAQRPLAEYFEQANLVALGKVQSSTVQENQRELNFSVQESAFKGLAGNGETVQVLSAVDSASCGIDPLPDTVYVLFGVIDPAAGNQLRIDSCSGTRPLADGFVDVPDRFVISQLTALQGLELLREYAAGMPDPNNVENSSLIGLLEVAPLAHGGVIPLFAEPDSSAEEIARIEEISQLFTREASYEFETAEVYARTGFGYRVRMRDGRFGWLANRDSGTWFPYESLAVDRLGYVVEGWSGFLWPGPGAGLPARLTGFQGERIAATVLDSTLIGGSLWFRIEVTSSDGCDGQDPELLLSGWTPAYLPTGEPLVWYYSRGC